MPSIRFDKDEVKQLAAGRWKEIFESLGVHFEVGKHGPCPRCGGRDRFRPFNDFAQTGGMICGAGGCDKSFSDGLEAVQWYTDCDFQAAVDKVGEIVGAKPKGKKKKQPIDRLQLDSEINELLLPYYLIHNEAINQTGLERMRARTGQFDDQVVMALPAWQTLDGKPTNWVVMSAMTKKIWHRENNRDVQVRKKTLGKGWGLMGAVKEMDAANVVWKCEGPTDCAAFLSHWLGVAVTNIHGASESPGPMVSLFAGKHVNICHDGDEAGQKGAAKWVEALREVGCSVRNVVLPEGYDLRGFLLEHDGGELLELANQAELLGPGAQADETAAENGAQPGQGSKAREPIDDYAYDRRLVPDDCIELLTRLQLEIVCQDDEGQVTIYSRATGLVRTVRNIERLQLANLLTFGGLPCYHLVTESDGEEVTKFSIREVRRSIGIAASSKHVAKKVELRGRGIYSTNGDVVLCNGNHLSIFTEDKDWIRTNRPFHGDLVFGFDGATQNWYDHDELKAFLEDSKDPKWCAQWIKLMEGYIDRWTFSNQKTDPLLMVGLVLASFVQQSWSWRPQVSIKGQSNAGKSALFKVFFGDERGLVGIFGDVGLKFAASTAAGIRQKIRSNSQVIGVDEFDQIKKPQEILNLIRTSGRGEKLVMGSTSHKHVEFGLMNICWLSGIFVGLDAEADQNRFLSFELKKPVEPKKSSFRQPTQSEINAVRNPLLAIAVSHVAQASIDADEAFVRCKDAIPINERLVESLAVPAAILGASTGGTVDDCVKLIEAFSVPLRADVDVTSDQDDLVLRILQLTIDVGAGAKVSAAQALCQPEYATHRKQVETQIGVARREGDNDTEWIVVHPGSVEKRFRAMGHDKPVTGDAVRQILRRISGSQKQRARLGGTQLNCVWIPWNYVRTFVDEENDSFPI